MKRSGFTKLVLLFVAVLTVNSSAYSQADKKADKDVTGVIVDYNGKPVKGVRLLVLNTKIAEKTNKKGEFKLKAVLPTDTVALLMKGNKGVKFLLGDVSHLKLKADRDKLQIDNGTSAPISLSVEDLIVKKYGGANIITAQMIERNIYLSIKEAIKACIPGVNFTYTSTGEEKVTIRGTKSFNCPTEPLVLLDGNQTNLDAANQMCDIRDVASIEVNKDGIGFGVKGANGVIIIKTKQH